MAVTLWRLAINADYHTIPYFLGISRGSICCIVQEVCTEIVRVLLPRYIRWPEGDNLQEVIDVFDHKWGYPQCGGAIDGNHIPIIATQHFHRFFQLLRVALDYFARHC